MVVDVAYTWAFLGPGLKKPDLKFIGPNPAQLHLRAYKLGPNPAWTDESMARPDKPYPN
jgi:hypothetical protein